MPKIIHKVYLVGNQIANRRKSAASQDPPLDVKACPRRIQAALHRRTPRRPWIAAGTSTRRCWDPIGVA